MILIMWSNFQNNDTLKKCWKLLQISHHICEDAYMYVYLYSKNIFGMGVGREHHNINNIIIYCTHPSPSEELIGVLN